MPAEFSAWNSDDHLQTDLSVSIKQKTWEKSMCLGFFIMKMHEEHTSPEVHAVLIVNCDCY